MNEQNIQTDGNRTEARLLHDIKTAAMRLSVSVPTVRKLIRQGRLRRVAGIRKILLSDGEMQRFATGE